MPAAFLPVRPLPPLHHLHPDFQVAQGWSRLAHGLGLCCALQYHLHFNMTLKPSFPKHSNSVHSRCHIFPPATPRKSQPHCVEDTSLEAFISAAVPEVGCVARPSSGNSDTVQWFTPTWSHVTSRSGHQIQTVETLDAHNTTQPEGSCR